MQMTQLLGIFNNNNKRDWNQQQQQQSFNKIEKSPRTRHDASSYQLEESWSAQPMDAARSPHPRDETIAPSTTKKEGNEAGTEPARQHLLHKTNSPLDMSDKSERTTSEQSVRLSVT